MKVRVAREERTYTPAEFRALTGLSEFQVWDYKRRGILPRSGRGRGSVYTDLHLQRVRIVRESQDARVTLDDLGERFTGARP